MHRAPIIWSEGPETNRLSHGTANSSAKAYFKILLIQIIEYSVRHTASTSVWQT
jgi:hypothetical protein